MLSSRPIIIACACALLLLAGAGRVEAGYIIYGEHTDHDLAPGASLTHVRLMVDLMVADSLATLTFTNASMDPENSAVFKQIVIDTTDEDTDAVVFWNGVILTNTDDVSYTLESYITMPGFNSIITDGDSMVRLEADPARPKMGIAPGEVLEVQFETSLPDGSALNDYFAFFGGGDDTGMYSIAAHAISADVVDGQSLSGAATEPPAPEPATLALLLLGAVPILARRRRLHA